MTFSSRTRTIIQQASTAAVHLDATYTSYTRDTHIHKKSLPFLPAPSLTSRLAHFGCVFCLFVIPGLNLRVSSAADLLEQNGQPRSDKSISPLQIDADELAFGTRDAKVYGASLQRDSWDANILLLAPLLNRIEEPLCSDRRGRGEYGEAAWLKAYLNRQEEENKTIHDVQTEAKNRLVQAGLMSRRNFAWTSC